MNTTHSVQAVEHQLPADEKVEVKIEDKDKAEAIASDGGCEMSENSKIDLEDVEKGNERDKEREKESEKEETSCDNESKKRKLDHVSDI